jgi:hypothetical protein
MIPIRIWATPLSVRKTIVIASAAKQSHEPGQSDRDCFVATLIAMDGMYAENAGAFFCRNDVDFRLK